MTTVPTPSPPNYLDDGATAYSPTGTGVRTGYGQVAGAAAYVYIGAGATAWNGVAVLNVTALATAGGQTYTLSIQGSIDDTFAAPVTLGSLQVAAVGQYLVPVYAYSGGVLYPYMRLEKMVTGASASITLNAFPLPFSGLSSLSLQDATAVFGLAAQNTQAIAASIIAWASGTATGGPNGDGQYPIYDAAGDSVLVLCPAASAALATSSGGSSGSGGGTTTTGVAGMVRVGAQESFDTAIARLGFSVHTDYLFGTAASAGAGQTAIANLTELEAIYNAFEDYTGMTKIGEEQERYQPFNATNHDFLSDRLQLTAVLDTSVYSGGYTTVVSQNNTYNENGVTPYGTPQPPGATNIAPTATTPNSIPIADLGWADTSHVQLGQLVYLQYMGMYYISELVENTSVTLTILSSTPYQTTLYANLNVVMPYFAVPLAGAVAASGTAVTQFTFSQALPAGVELGQIFTWAYGGNANQATADLRVTAINTATNTVTVSTGILYTTIPAGAVGIFGPPINSGQVWTKEHFDFSGAQTPAWAFDWYVYLPNSVENPTADCQNIQTLSALDALASDFPWGAWPALWFYSAADGDSFGQPDTSEIDVHEGFYGTAYGPYCLCGADHPGASDVTTQNSELSSRLQRYGRSSGYTQVSGAVKCPTSMADGQVRISIIITPTDTYRFVNGVLLLWHHFEWTSVDHAQMGMDMAVGSFGNYNLLLNLNLAGLANMKFGISRVIARKI